MYLKCFANTAVSDDLYSSENEDEGDELESELADVLSVGQKLKAGEELEILASTDAERERIRSMSKSNGRPLTIPGGAMKQAVENLLFRQREKNKARKKAKGKAKATVRTGTD